MDSVSFKYTMGRWKNDIQIGQEIHNPDNIQGSFFITSIVRVECCEGDIIVYGTGMPVKLFE
ncbi:hypothetical protein D3C87_891610 [compost metagenome]